MKARQAVLAVVCLAALVLGTGVARGQSSGSIVAWGDNWNGQCDVPEPNADFVAIAAWNSRFKNENRSLFLEAKDICEFRRVVAERIDYYNGERRHSALGNQAPLVWVARLRTSA